MAVVANVFPCCAYSKAGVYRIAGAVLTGAGNATIGLGGTVEGITAEDSVAKPAGRERESERAMPQKDRRGASRPIARGRQQRSPRTA